MLRDVRLVSETGNKYYFSGIGDNIIFHWVLVIILFSRMAYIRIVYIRMGVSNSNINGFPKNLKRELRYKDGRQQQQY